VTIERIVRPFQLTEVFNARVLPPNQDKPPEEQKDVIIEVKSSADKDYIDEPPPFFMGYEVKWEEDKKQRVTETVRIKNKDDPETYLDVERIKKMVMKNTTTGEQLPLNMDWSDSGGSA